MNSGEATIEIASIVKFQPTGEDVTSLNSDLKLVDAEIGRLSGILRTANDTREALLNEGSAKSVVDHDALMKEAEVSLEQFQRLRTTVDARLKTAEAREDIAAFEQSVAEQHQAAEAARRWAEEIYPQISEMVAEGKEIFSLVEQRAEYVRRHLAVLGQTRADDPRRALFGEKEYKLSPVPTAPSGKIGYAGGLYVRNDPVNLPDALQLPPTKLGPAWPLSIKEPPMPQIARKHYTASSGSDEPRVFYANTYRGS